MRKRDMSIEEAILLIRAEYADVKDNEFIKKPISYALYQTWKFVDSHEKRRRTSDT